MDTKAPSSAETKSRQILTFLVICISILGVVVLGLVVLCFGRDLSTAQFVFGAILPLFASWVGTIMAFYFSKDNFQAANQAVSDMAKTVTSIERLKGIPVAGKMRPIEKITYTQVKPADDQTTKLVALLSSFGDCERMLILGEDNSVRYLIYQALARKYLTNLWVNTPPETTPPDPRASTLKDLAGSPVNANNLIQKSFVFVSADATLGDAKLKMDALKNCNDAFVTKSGSPDESLLGWVTDNTIAENSVV
jgi:hypothetical protein